MKTLGYYNGKYDLLEKMTVPMNDRACYFGDGVYEATQCANRVMFALDEHLDRLFRSAEMLGIQIPKTKEELGSILQDLVNKLDSPDQFVYWQVSRGTDIRGHAFPAADVPANIWVMLRPYEIEFYREKFKLITLEDTRFLHCNIKTLNLIPSVMAVQQAKEGGCDEAVLHRSGRVTECSHSNVSILKDGIFRTAPADNLILSGIARKHLIGACEALDIPVSEEPFSLEELMAADEIIVSSSSNPGMDVCEIDGTPVGGKDQQRYRRIKEYVVQEFRQATAGR